MTDMTDMRCDDCRALLDAHLDGELMPAEARQVRDHLESCGACAAEHVMVTHLSSRLRSALVRPRAPDVLKARIRSVLAHPESAVPGAPRRLPSWGLIAAGLLIAMVSAGGGAYLANARGERAPRVWQEVLSSHLRSLVPGHLTDVASNDLHNVKPWFNGRAGFSPAVPRLDSAGFPLVGGRVDYVGDRQVAAVVYGRRQHVINVFSWPAANEAPAQPKVSNERGYHLVRWVDAGVEHWAASDLSVPDLRLFIALFRQEAAR